MGEVKIGATARVQVLVDVYVSDGWGTTCTVEQIYRQAASGALGQIEQINQMFLKERHRRVLTVIGEPKVTAVLVEKEQ